ncbi:MAG: hypothetical protein IAF08_11335 [Rhizobacter sp.]|nr:hypothetical protein [Chlorobiales bacterium]
MTLMSEMNRTKTEARKNKMHRRKWQHVLLAALMLLMGHASSIAKPTTVTVLLYGTQNKFTITEEIARLRAPAGVLTTRQFDIALDAAQMNLSPLASQLSHISDKLAFSDWLRFKLATETAKKIWKPNSDRVLGSIAILRAMGYNAVGVQQMPSGDWGLAIEITQKVYFATSFSKAEHKYCIYNLSLSAMDRLSDTQKSTILYDANIDANGLPKPAAASLKPVDLADAGAPLLPESTERKTLQWTFESQAYKLPVEINKNLLKYFADYPQVDLDVYFKQPVGSAAKTKVVDALGAMLKEKKLSGESAINFLLAFCHKAFMYQDDAKTLRGEHSNFVEETLVSNRSDCEDRTILLSALVRDLLGYNAVGLEFDNHVALAVEVPNVNSKDGTAYKYGGANYISCDPSFIGGSLGDVQPSYKGVTPKRIIPAAKAKVSLQSDR